MLTVLGLCCAGSPHAQYTAQRPRLCPELGSLFFEGEALAGHDANVPRRRPYSLTNSRQDGPGTVFGDRS